jgi:hypothetical protein
VLLASTFLPLIVGRLFPLSDNFQKRVLKTSPVRGSRYLMMDEESKPI